MKSEYITKIIAFFTELSPYVGSLKDFLKLNLEAHVDALRWSIHLVDKDGKSTKCLELGWYHFPEKYTSFDYFIKNAIKKIKPYCK